MSSWIHGHIYASIAVSCLPIYSYSANFDTTGGVSRLVQPQEYVTQLRLKSADNAVVNVMDQDPSPPNVIMM